MATRPIADPTPETIYIRGGQPSSSSITISENQDVVFDNQDSGDYILEFWASGNNHRIDICPVIPAQSTLTYQPDPGNTNGNGKCHYNILTPSGRSTRPTNTGGSNVIIIGSGK